MPVTLAAEPFLTVEQVRESTICAGCIHDDTPDDVIQGWIDQASDIIANVSGMRVAGQFHLVARPCNFGMRCGCDCCHLDAVPFGGSKPTITSVNINGNVIDPEEYDLHWTLNGWNLVSIGDGITAPRSWPTVQDLWRRDDSDRTFTVHFVVGLDVSQVLIYDAAMELVCDIASASSDQADMLQPGVTQASLGGTTIMVDPDRLARIAAGEMGPALSKMLAVFAPGGRQTSAVYAPELHDGWELHLKVDASA